MPVSSLSAAKYPASVGPLAWRYGLLAFGLMLIYFLTVNGLGLQHSELARFGSLAFTVLAVVRAIRVYKGRVREPGVLAASNGLPGVVSGPLTGYILMKANGTDAQATRAESQDA